MKKGQEEMVGLVIIMLVVAVIFLFFLMFSFNSNSGKRSSVEVTQFLDSSFEVSSNCSLNGYNYKSIEDLFEECEGNGVCLGGENSCDVLKSELTNLIEKSWNFNPESVTKGYRLNSVYQSRTGAESDLPLGPITNGTCAGEVRGDDRAIPLSDGGKILVSLEICY